MEKSKFFSFSSEELSETEKPPVAKRAKSEPDLTQYLAQDLAQDLTQDEPNLPVRRASKRLVNQFRPDYKSMMGAYRKKKAGKSKK